MIEPAIGGWNAKLGFVMVSFCCGDWKLNVKLGIRVRRFKDSKLGKKGGIIFSWETKDPDSRRRDLGVVAEGKDACDVVVVRGEVGVYLCDRIWID
jgi:hypothetical protein